MVLQHQARGLAFGVVHAAGRDVGQGEFVVDEHGVVNDRNPGIGGLLAVGAKFRRVEGNKLLSPNGWIRVRRCWRCPFVNHTAQSFGRCRQFAVS